MAFLLAGLALASPVLAHDSPHGIQLIFPSPAADAAPIALTNRGLMFPETANIGSAYSLRCNESYKINSAAIPYALLDDMVSLLVATTIDLRTSPDRGCTWKADTQLPEESLGGFAQNASTPAELLVSTQTYEHQSQIFASADYGRSWSLKASNNMFSVYEHLLSSADGKRVLASGHRFDMAAKKLLSLWSTSSDGGTTWADQDIPSDRFPLGFHPTDANVVFAREPIPNLTIDPRDRLVRSSDGGKTFAPVLELPFLGTFAATPDGSSIWIGSQTDGLQVSKDGGKTFARVQPDTIIGVYCLHYRQNRLWACTRNVPNTGGIWYSDDQAGSFSKLLQFDEVKTPISCPNDIEMVCAVPWRDWSYELLSNFEDAGVPSDSGISVVTDAGAPQDLDASIHHDAGHQPIDAGHDGGTQPIDDGVKVDSGCSCSAVPSDGSGAAFTPLFALGALALVQRRRRR